MMYNRTQLKEIIAKKIDPTNPMFRRLWVEVCTKPNTDFWNKYLNLKVLTYANN
jgi:hypothetical protein